MNTATATLLFDNTLAIIDTGKRSQQYTLDRLETGDNTRRVLGIVEQYAALGPRGAYYLFQTYNDGTFNLKPMAMGRHIIAGTVLVAQ